MLDMDYAFCVERVLKAVGVSPLLSSSGRFLDTIFPSFIDRSLIIFRADRNPSQWRNRFQTRIPPPDRNQNGPPTTRRSRRLPYQPLQQRERRNLDRRRGNTQIETQFPFRCFRKHHLASISLSCLSNNLSSLLLSTGSPAKQPP